MWQTERNQIFVEGLTFLGRHGCYPNEREEGRRFQVDVTATVARHDGFRSDRLEDTAVGWLADIDADDGSNNHSDEKRAKYNELVKRDEEMQKFLDAYAENQEAESKQVDEVEDKIVDLLERISHNVTRSGQMPTKDEAMAGKAQLAFKQNGRS